MNEITLYYFYTPYFAQIDEEAPEQRQYFLDVYDTLPQQLKDFLVSESTAGQVVGLGNKYGLVRDQKEVLSRIIRDVVSGIYSTNDLQALLTNELQLPPEYISEIYNDTAQIFEAILNSIQEPTNLTPPPVIPGQQVNPNNIIDLRQQNK